MATQTDGGVSLEQLMEALSRLTTFDQRPPTAQEAKVIGHFTDLVAFLGRDGGNVPFQFVEDDDDGAQLPRPVATPDKQPTGQK
jgi:hypothetical protein